MDKYDQMTDADLRNIARGMQIPNVQAYSREMLLTTIRKIAPAPGVSEDLFEEIQPPAVSPDLLSDPQLFKILST